MILGDPEPGALERVDGVGLVAGVNGQVEVIVGAGLLADQGVDAPAATDPDPHPGGRQAGQQVKDLVDVDHGAAGRARSQVMA
jgi:hypothetical protein